MFTINASQAIVALVESMLPRGNAHQALYVALNLRLGSLEAGTQSSSLALFVYRPSAYTLVAARTDVLGVSREQGERFQLRSYHDSTWRFDGVEETFRLVYQELRERLTPDRVSLRASAEFDSHRGLGIRPVERVEFDSTDYEKPVVVHWKN